MGSLQQPIWVKGSSVLSHKGSAVVVEFPHQARLNVLKSCRCSSPLEASLITGRPPSSASVPAPDMGLGGDYRLLDSWLFGTSNNFIPGKFNQCYELNTFGGLNQLLI